MRARKGRRRDLAARRERLVQPAAAFAHESARAPEANEHAGEPQRDLRVAGLDRPREGGADVVGLLVEPTEPDRLVRARELGLGRLDEREVPLGMTLPKRLEGVAPRRAVRARTAGSTRAGRSAARRRRRPTGGRGSCRRARRSWSSTEPMRASSAHTASAISSEQPPEKTPSRRKQALLCRIEQVVAPLDRGAQRALPLGQVAGAAGEQVEALAEPRQDRLRRQELHARSRELERERQPVEPARRSLRPRRGCRRRARSSASPSCARWTKSSTADAGSSGGTGNTRSSRRLSGAWLVASTVSARCGERAARATNAPRGAPARSCRARRAPARRSACGRATSTSGTSGDSSTPSTRAIAEPTSAGSEVGARSTNAACSDVVRELGCSGEREPRLAGAAEAGERQEPCTSGRRASSTTAASSAPRPISGVGCAAGRPRTRRAPARLHGRRPWRDWRLHGRRAPCEPPRSARGSCRTALSFDLRERAADHSVERLGQLGPQLAHRGAASCSCACMTATSVSRSNGFLPGERLEEQAAERVDVGGRPDRLAADLLGRRIVERADEEAGAREASRAGALRDPEVREVDAPGLFLDQHVRRLDVAMHELVSRARSRARRPPARGSRPRAPARAGPSVDQARARSPPDT